MQDEPQHLHSDKKSEFESKIANLMLLVNSGLKVGDSSSPEAAEGAGWFDISNDSELNTDDKWFSSAQDSAFDECQEDEHGDSVDSAPLSDHDILNSLIQQEKDHVQTQNFIQSSIQSISISSLDMPSTDSHRTSSASPLHYPSQGTMPIMPPAHMAQLPMPMHHDPRYSRSDLRPSSVRDGHPEEFFSRDRDRVRDESRPPELNRTSSFMALQHQAASTRRPEYQASDLQQQAQRLLSRPSTMSLLPPMPPHPPPHQQLQQPSGSPNATIESQPHPMAPQQPHYRNLTRVPSMSNVPAAASTIRSYTDLKLPLQVPDHEPHSLVPTVIKGPYSESLSNPSSPRKEQQQLSPSLRWESDVYSSTATHRVQFPPSQHYQPDARPAHQYSEERIAQHQHQHQHQNQNQHQHQYQHQHFEERVAQQQQEVRGIYQHPDYRSQSFDPSGHLIHGISHPPMQAPPPHSNPLTEHRRQQLPPHPETFSYQPPVKPSLQSLSMEPPSSHCSPGVGIAASQDWRGVPVANGHADEPKRARKHPSKVKDMGGISTHLAPRPPRESKLEENLSDEFDINGADFADNLIVESYTYAQSGVAVTSTKVMKSLPSTSDSDSSESEIMSEAAFENDYPYPPPPKYGAVVHASRKPLTVATAEPLPEGPVQMDYATAKSKMSRMKVATDLSRTNSEISVTSPTLSPSSSAFGSRPASTTLSRCSSELPSPTLSRTGSVSQFFSKKFFGETSSVLTASSPPQTSAAVPDHDLALKQPHHGAAVSADAELVPTSSPIEFISEPINAFKRRDLLPFQLIQVSSSYPGAPGYFSGSITLKQEILPKAKGPQGSRPDCLQVGLFSTSLEARRLCEAHVPPVWQSEAPVCSLCPAAIASSKRGMHCRNCGYYVCTACCAKAWPSVMVSPYYHNNERSVHVCSSCNFLVESFREALCKGDLEKAQAIFASGNVNTHFPIASGGVLEYPVQCVARGGSVELMRWLLEDQFCKLVDDKQIPFKNSAGLSVLAIAAKYGHCELMKYLVRQGRLVTEIIDVFILQRALHLLLEAPGPLPPLPKKSGWLSGSKHASEDKDIDGILVPSHGAKAPAVADHGSTSE